MKTSKSATARVRDPLPIQINCPNCDGEVKLVTNDVIYGKKYGKWSYIYMCADCDSYVGLHPFTDIPLGYLADKRTRDARKFAKPIFEKLFKDSIYGLTRSQAYQLLADELTIDKSKCHFAMFCVIMCELSVTATNNIIKRIT